MTAVAKVSARRTLAQEIEKLGAILDGLSDTLRGAVAESVPQAVEATLAAAVGPAVEQAVQQILKHPDHQARQSDAFTPKPLRILPEPTPASCSEGGLTSAWDRCYQVLHHAANVVADVARVCTRIARRRPGVALASCGTAVVALMAAWWCGPCMGALVGWAGGLLTARVSQRRDTLFYLVRPNSTSDGEPSPDPAARS